MCGVGFSLEIFPVPGWKVCEERAEEGRGGKNKEGIGKKKRMIEKSLKVQLA